MCMYYTATALVHNRISRFTANGDVAVAGSELVVLISIISAAQPITTVARSGSVPMESCMRPWARTATVRTRNP